MSQNDFNLANQGFPAMRADMNSAFQALASNSSGATEPGTTYAYQWWYDETTDILKIRNADDDAWINIASFDQANDTWSPYVGSTALTATGAELNQLDGNSFTADVLPDADSTRDLGSSTKAWAEAHVDTVISTNVSDGTLSIPTTYITNGSAKAWVNFDGTGTIAARDSLNVSSLTDNGTGDYDANYTSNFGSDDYAFIFTLAETGNINVAKGNHNNVSSSYVEINTGSYQEGSTNVSVDATYVTASIFGDLA